MRHGFALAIAALLLGGCSTLYAPFEGDAPAPKAEGSIPLSSVPSTIPSLDNDRAQMDDQINAKRVASLKQRVDAFKTTGDPEAPVETKAPVVPVAAEPAPMPTPVAEVPPAPEPTVPPPAAEPKVSMSVSGNPSKVVQEVAAVFPTAPAVAQTPSAPPLAPEPAPAMPAPTVAPLPEKAPLVLRPLPPVAESTRIASLGEVTFRVGSAKLSQQDLSRLADMIRHLENIQAQGTYVVEGYASVDPSPKRAFANATLAYDRARAVADALIFLGVDAERISVHGRSTQNPYNDGSANRRAVVWFKQ